MEDDDGNRIDNHGEVISFTLHMKKKNFHNLLIMNLNI